MQETKNSSLCPPRSTPQPKCTDTSSAQCTLETPACKNCIKSKRECLGYEKEMTFILDDRTRKDVFKIESRELTTSTTSSPSLSRQSPAPEVAQLEGSISTKNAYSSIWTISSPSTRAVYRQQIINEFLHSYSGGKELTSSGEAKTQTNSSGSWIEMLPFHPEFTTALEATTLAICTAKLGRSNNDQALVHESLKFYIQGLWELQKALYTPELMYKDETAAACMSLIFYEVMECPDQTIKGWEKHMKGCAKLFETRGPRAYGSEFAHRLFLAFRTMEVSSLFFPFLDKAHWGCRSSNRLQSIEQPSSRVLNGRIIPGKATKNQLRITSSILWPKWQT